MTPEEFDEFIAQHIEWMRQSKSDNARIEAKRVRDKIGKSLWETVSAFANTDGGIIILGLNEEGGFVPDPNFQLSTIKSALMNGLDTAALSTAKVKPVPRHHLYEVRFEGHELIAIEIEALRDDPQLATQMPCFLTDRSIASGSFKRVFDGDKLMNAYEIHAMQTWLKQDLTDRGVIAEADKTDIDEFAVQLVISAYREEGSRLISVARDQEELWRFINAFDFDENRKLRPTLAGVLALGRYPQQFFPQLFIDVTTHPGTTKSSGIDGLRFISRKRCDGPLPDAIEAAVAEVMSNLKTRYVESEGAVINEKEIPELAIREAIANAVMHRDYGPFARGEQVAVDIYADRVEIVNPGGLWGGRTEDNITDGRSVTRNEALASIMSHLHNRRSERIAENQGSGIPAIIRAMAGHGLGAPLFRNEIGTFRVTLPRFGLINDESQLWLDHRGHLRNPVSDIALLLAREEGRVTTTSLRKHMGIDSDEARDILDSLLVEGQLEAAGPEEFVVAPMNVDLDVSEPARELYEVVEAERALKTSELATRWGRAESTVRLRIKELLQAGLVEATAPTTSKLRAYRRTSR